MPGSVDAIVDALRWAGLKFDEGAVAITAWYGLFASAVAVGPGVGGPAGPYVQSERLPLYRERAEALLLRRKPAGGDACNTDPGLLPASLRPRMLEALAR